jgi:acyl-ACP thioesterase
MELLHTLPVRVGLHEVGPNGEARPSEILNWLQEAAEAHASTVGLGATDLFRRGRTWVLSRYHLELARSPVHGEELIVSTWPSSRASPFATRDFELHDARGERILRATTSWAMIDLVTKRPVDFDDVLPEGFVRPVRALETTFPSLPRLVAPERELTVPVMLRDLDVNVHVNHTVYVSWATESLPLDVLRSHRLHTLEVGYRAEVRYGEAVVSRRGPAVDEAGDHVFVHGIANAATGAELTRLRTRWTPR